MLEISFKLVHSETTTVYCRIYLHWTTTFEIPFSDSSDTTHNSLLWFIFWKREIIDELYTFFFQASRHLDELLSVLCTDVDDKLEEEATLNMLENINIHTRGL